MTDPSLPATPPDEAPIQFHCEDVKLKLPDPGLLRRWIQQVLNREDCRLESINFIFCSDEYLLRINLEYLRHNTFTDIITFPYQEPPVIEGDVFISLERVRENAETYHTSFYPELHRVMIHGVLHLCGYPDKTPEEKKRMTEKENESLHLLNEIQLSD